MTWAVRLAPLDACDAALIARMTLLRSSAGSRVSGREWAGAMAPAPAWIQIFMTAGDREACARTVIGTRDRVVQAREVGDVVRYGWQG
jgi:hypothetical protein